MKLVFQIAGGIILAVIIISTIFGMATEYQLRQLEKEIAAQEQKRIIRNKAARVQFAKKREADRIAKLRKLKQAAPIAQVSWSEGADSSIASKERQFLIPNGNGARTKISTPRSYEKEAPQILETQDVLQQLIKKNNGFQ